VTVPFGDTVQDWVELPPAAELAVTVKLLETRDCAAVGVQVIVLPVRAAPVGAAVRAKFTVAPEATLAWS
jgi:hypothetical protein